MIYQILIMNQVFSIFLSERSNSPRPRDDLGLNLTRLTLVLALNSYNMPQPTQNIFILCCNLLDLFCQIIKFICPGPPPPPR
jgi:hypothetical protein